MMKQNYLTLNDGNKIPQMGLGVYMVRGDELTCKTCLAALQMGYRHIDTAHAYQNERGVGKAIKESGIRRDEIWVTTKLWPSEYGKGKSERLEEVLDYATIKPSVLQVECHPYYPQNKLKERIAAYGTKIESWYPLGHGDASLLNESVLVELSKKYNKSTAQIILRWHIQEGNIVFPKTTNPEHMKENFDIFDFELSDDEMKQIQSLDKNQRYFTLSLAQQEAHLSGFVPED